MRSGAGKQNKCRCVVFLLRVSDDFKKRDAGLDAMRCDAQTLITLGEELRLSAAASTLRHTRAKSEAEMNVVS